MATIITDAIAAIGMDINDGDIFVIAQKVVSKSEDCYVDLNSISPSAEANKLAILVDKDPRLVEVILSESAEVIRSAPGVLVVEHRLGYVLANAGIDASNLPQDSEGCENVLLLPKNPNASSARLRKHFEKSFNRRIGVIISDSVGRAWRNGSIGLALGVAGPPALWDRIGELDFFGRALKITQIGFADQIASAAALIMGEGAEGIPVAKVGGLNWQPVDFNGDTLLRPKEKDLFR